MAQHYDGDAAAASSYYYYSFEYKPEVESTDNNGDDDDKDGCCLFTANNGMVSGSSSAQTLLQDSSKEVSHRSRPSSSNDDDDNNDEYIKVNLADFRKEFECPICLGIIRKTRIVMECLHRFCKECIDKAIRLGKKECPACRRHCPSRRSLRDDPTFDALIAAIYPNLDNFEEEELAMDEKDEMRYKQIHKSIDKTPGRQSEALLKHRAAAMASETTPPMRIENGKAPHSQNEEILNEGGRRKRRRISPPKDHGNEEVNKQPSGLVNGVTLNHDNLVWGKFGKRTQRRR